MPALLLSEESVTVLNELISKYDSEAAFDELRFQLKEALKPEQEGALYPKGTVITHQCLVRVARWAAGRNSEINNEFKLCNLVKGAQVAFAIKPKPARVSRLTSGSILPAVTYIFTS